MNKFIFDLQRFALIINVNGVTIPYDNTLEAYTISTLEQLQALVVYVNAGNNVRGDYKKFRLIADIDLSTVDNWTPIGKNYSGYFRGTFDGGIYDAEGNLVGCHTISGLKITSNAEYVGLFGFVRDSTIKNVNLTNVNISGSGSEVGGIAGYNDGTIENCIINGNISGNRSIGGIVG